MPAPAAAAKAATTAAAGKLLYPRANSSVNGGRCNSTARLTAAVSCALHPTPRCVQPRSSLLNCAVIHAAGEEQDLAGCCALARIHVADEHDVQVLAVGGRGQQACGM